MKLIRFELPDIPNLPHSSLFSQDWERWARDTFGGISGFAGNLLEQNLSARSRVAADLHQDDKNYYFHIEAPGVKKDNIEIELENSVLSVNFTCESKSETSESSESYSRSFSLADDIDTEKIEAKLTDGILAVTIPKSPKKQSQTIKVS